MARQPRIGNKNYVESNMEDVRNPFDEVKAGIVFGVESFIEKIKKIISDKKNKQGIVSVKKLEIENRYSNSNTLKKELNNLKCIM